MKTTNSILRVIASVIAAGQNQISITELVSLSGISRQSVKRAIQILEQTGQITVTRTTTNGKREANTYYLPDQDLGGGCHSTLS
ncbi:HTH domain-containing protein [Escherichia coli]|uniref:HTH domain-containing protein n=1 Tax=Escherichia coli TaxID=562 RepID=UPI0010CB431F|nr:HTH domain-containing protein [Escherichia coli]